jgi:hypothetical protein
VTLLPDSETDGICYETPASEPATYHWREMSDGGAKLYLSFDFFKPGTAAQDPKRPLIVYFHPNGVKSHLVYPKQMWKNIVQPAMAQGWAVATVEFRHPVADAYLEDPEGAGSFTQGLAYSPTYDTGYAMQFLRANAARLDIDPDRLFALGYSRGSLALWQSLQTELASRDYPYSSVARAFYGYQAQTTYQCAEYGTAFIMKDNAGVNDRAAFITDCKADNPRYREFGSTLQSVSADTTLPMMLRYADPFYLDGAGAVKLNTWWAIQHYNRPLYPDRPDLWDDTEHYPDMGAALRQAYQAAAGPFARIDVADCRNDTADGFADWVGFVKNLLGE